MSESNFTEKRIDERDEELKEAEKSLKRAQRRLQ
jgi:hypothetical protein